ncbi:MAG: tetratricopeptide repeat protein [Deltaproteobacteria bacterium]|nr:tetratricopeptide repeat protein [Deltaproteobacteria bacterium]
MRRFRRQIALLLCLALSLPGLISAQQPNNLTQKLIQSYDLMEAGKLEEAKKVYEEILAEQPGNPLALNNLAAVLVKQKDYRGALSHLEKALPQAKDYRVTVSRLCEVDGICLAFRPMSAAYGTQELEPLIRLNIELLKSKMAAEGQAG